MANFLKAFNISATVTRNIGNARGRKAFKYSGEGIPYFGFKYYPRDPETFQDPPYEASKLFRIQRIKPLKGLPHWEKRILKELGIDGKQSEVNVVKNIPEVNVKLWQVKHVIRISPITFPNGFPKDDCGTYLKENGEMVVAKKVDCSENIKALEEIRNDPKRMDGDTLRRDSRIKWLSGW